MPRIMFPSLTFGDRIGYLLDSNWNTDHWRMQDSDYIHPYTKYYDTYGDGFVQHSKETPIPIRYFGDWCASLAMFIQAEAEAGRRDAVELLASNWPDKYNGAFVRSHIIKASKVKFKPLTDENQKTWKRQYINIAELTVSTSDSKRYDTRWTELNEGADGTARGIFYILNLGKGSLSGLECYMRYKIILEVLHDLTGESQSIPSNLFDKCVNAGDGWRAWEVRDAFNALEYAVISERNREYAARAAKSLQSNIDYQMEKRAKAAGLVELTEEVANS